MEVKSSELKHKIAIYKPSEIVNGEYGAESVPRKVYVKDVYSKILYQRYYDKIKTQGTYMENSLTFIIRSDSAINDINTIWEIKYKERTFNVLQTEMSYDEKFILLTCKEKI